MCHLFISLRAALCRSDLSSFASCRPMLLSVLYLLLTLALSSFFYFLSPLLLFSGLDCFQEPHGVKPDLSLSVQLSMCSSSSLCPVHSFLSISLHASAAAVLFELDVLIKCHVLLFAVLIISTTVTIKDAGIYSVCLM